MRATFALAAIASLVPQALATLFPTSPVATTICTAGQSCSITWDDRNGNPTLAQIGLVRVGLYTGNAQQQTLIQAITTDPIAASLGTVPFTPNAAAGANSKLYFIRFDAVNFTDPTTLKPMLSFTAKFELQGMTGTFNATVQQQIDNISSSIGQTSGAPTSTTGASTTGTKSTSSTSTSTTKPSGAASANQVALPLLGGALAALGLFAL